MNPVKRFSILVIVILAVFGLSACKATPEPTPEPTEAVTAEVQPTEEAQPANTPVPEPTAVPTSTPVPPTDTPVPVAEPTETPMPEPTATPVPPTPTEEPADKPDTAQPVIPAATSVPSLVRDEALTLLEDTDPAPPLTIIVSANRELEDYKYLVSGYLRNDSAETYKSLGVVATFYINDERRYGPVRIRLTCPILNPGDACPFTVDTIAKDLTSVMLHPEGQPTDRVVYVPDVWVASSYVDAAGYVHISGTVHNPFEFSLLNISLTAALTDSQGEVVSVGTRLLITPLDAGRGASFNIPVMYRPYSSYSLYIQAEAQ